MKVKSLVAIVLLFALIMVGIAQIRPTMNTYESKWKEVEKVEGEGRPLSAIKLIDDVLAQSKKDNSLGQRLKALVKRSALRNSINSDNQYLLVAELNDLLKEVKEDADKAVIHSLLAITYDSYYSDARWRIDSRTKLDGFVPEDMEEWSSNIYKDTIQYHIEKSIENRDVLLKTLPDKYDGLIEKGEDSKEYYPTLYDFLMRKGISLLQKNVDIPMAKDQHIGDLDEFLSSDVKSANTALNYYKVYLKDLSDRKQENTLVLTELDRLEYLFGYNQDFPILDYLTKLETKYQNKEISIDIISKIVEYSSYQPIDEGQDRSAHLKISYDWLKKGIDRFPNSKKIVNLKNLLSQMENPFVSVNLQSIYYPTKEKPLKIEYRNKKSVSIKIRDDKNNIVLDKKYTLNPATTYSTQDTTINIVLDKIGTYTLLIEDEVKNDERVFRVSKLLSLSRSFGADNFEFFVFDRQSGKPMEGVSVELSVADSWNGEKTVIETMQSQKYGLAQYTKQKDDKRRYYYYRVIDKKTGDISDYSNLYGGSSYRADTDDSQENVSIFTDRSVYRPGQTVYFKAIAYSNKDKKADLLTNKILKIRMYDANGQEINSKGLKTNDFGSVSGEFVLPKSVLNGYFSIRTDEGSYFSFRVEEYKRPTFEVKFDKNEETYSFGDKITLKGLVESYAGVKLQGATVNYRINRVPLFHFMSRGTLFIGAGEIKTSYDGSFEVEFQIPEKTKSNVARKLWFPETYMFSVVADVTDENGETQSTTSYIYVGEISMKLNLNLSSKFNKERGENITISAENLSGSPIDAKGTVNISKIRDNDTISIAQMSFTTGVQKQLEEKLKSLASGEYLIKVTSQDDKNRKIETSQDVIIYSNKDKRPPVMTNDWLIVNDSVQVEFYANNLRAKFSLKNPAKIAIGVSAKDVTVIYEIISSENKLLNREFFTLNNSIKELNVPYKEEYKNSVTVCLTYVIDEGVYSKQVKLDKEVESNDLKLKFEVFRDKLRPGQQEEWRMSLLDSHNLPAVAEVLASMYDRSIDQIQQTQEWDFTPISYNEYYYISELGGDNTRKRDFSIYKGDNVELLKEFNYKFDDFFNIYPIIQEHLMLMDMAVPKEMEASSDQKNLVKEEASGGVAGSMRKKTLRFTPPQMTQDESVEVENEEFAPQIRQNFNETAFFYPHLTTNEKGEVVISFLVPESNTSWKFRALAYDKTLNVGRLDAIAASRKELMVTPNAPRFLREGDKTSISTKVSNLSDKSINGDVKIELFDPMTDKPLNIKIESQTQKFEIGKDASTSVQWIFDVPQSIDMVAYRIVAKSATFSDGEQHVLSVLPNRMLVTESMPIDVVKAGTKDFVFDRFLNSKSSIADNYRLTFEYAANPAWYAIQSLPVLSNPTNENSVNWFASYYANTLSSYIVKQYPKVSSMIRAWQGTGGDAGTLMSKLEKNEELKSVLLEETPWVLEAKDETEQMQRLVLLFDLNRTSSLQNAAIKKLADLQTSSGGWSWFKDSYPSRTITQYILYGFTSLIELNAVEYPQEVKEMQMKALKYIDKSILDDYNSLKKNNKGWQNIKSLGTDQLEYIYVRSSYRDIPIDQETRQAERFYTSVAEKNWRNLNLYERSLLLVVAKRNSNKELAQKIFASLKEYATVKDNLGMYWDDKNTRSRCFMSASSVPVHTFLMKAFEEMGASTEEMNLLKQWLLTQKRTQLWESTHATIDAVSALLRNGDDWFSTENGDKIRVGKSVLDMSGAEKGTGYMKHVWTKSEISQDLARISIDKKGTTPSFGAMYWQYYEDLDKISQQKIGLSVDKKLFKESLSDKGSSLQEVSSNNKLKVGDKVVVRLTVRADRDFDFVHLKDMRAACFEPTQTVSGRNWRGELSFYQETKDASTNFYIDYLSKGTYVLEYSVYVNRSGNYSNGISSIQCLYSPEFTSHTGGIRVEIAQ